LQLIGRPRRGSSGGGGGPSGVHIGRVWLRGVRGPACFAGCTCCRRRRRRHCCCWMRQACGLRMHHAHLVLVLARHHHADAHAVGWRVAMPWWRGVLSTTTATNTASSSWAPCWRCWRSCSCLACRATPRTPSMPRHRAGTTSLGAHDGAIGCCGPDSREALMALKHAAASPCTTFELNERRHPRVRACTMSQSLCACGRLCTTSSCLAPSGLHCMRICDCG
jgi:hypothetical protein